jgi:hypothetical protein
MSNISRESADSVPTSQYGAYHLVRAAAGEHGDGGRVGALRRAATLREIARDREAVRRSLGWAQESADRGDYADALGWIELVEAIEAKIPTRYLIDRQAWGSPPGISVPAYEASRARADADR